MGKKRKRICCYVSDVQHDALLAKAKDYGISMSELLLRAAEAYVRVYGDQAPKDGLVAVDYGIWTLVDVRMQNVEDALADIRLQLLAIRRSLKGVVARPSDVGTSRVEAMAVECCDRLEATLGELSGSLSLHDQACRSANIEVAGKGAFEAAADGGRGCRSSS